MKNPKALLISIFCLSISICQAQWSEVQKFWPDNVVEDDGSSQSVKFDGTTAVVGSYGNGYQTGKADIFEKNEGTGEWEHLLTLQPPALDFGGYFGLKVAIDGDVVAVAAYRSDDTSPENGEVYTFHRDQGGTNNWGYVKKLVPILGYVDSYQSHFGFSLDISGDNIIVGSTGYDLAPNPWSSNAGRAYIFNRNQGGTDNWGQVKFMEQVDGEFDGENDHFGLSVAIDGDRCVVYSEDDITFSQSGAVWVFEKDYGGFNNWGLVKKIKASDPMQNHFFGAGGLDISGDLIAVGAPFDADVDLAAGAAYVFSKDEGGSNNWGEVIKIYAPDGEAQDHFGEALAIHENKLIVGSTSHNLNYDFFGAAWIFHQDEGGADNWGFVQKIGPSDYQPYGMRFSTSLDMDDNTIIVGAPSDYEAFPNNSNAESGATYVFTATIAGCASSVACNFNPQATDDDGSCYFIGDACDDGNNNTVNDVYQDDCNCAGEAIVEGCINSSACNFNSGANVDDGTCYYIGDSCDDEDEWTENDAYNVNCECVGEDIPQVFGCMDSEACNYDSLANVDDGSCYNVDLYTIIGSSSVNELEETIYNYNSTLGSSYNWTVESGAVVLGQGTNSITAVWSNAGTYDVSVTETDEEGCEGETVSLSVTVGSVGINDNQQEELIIYPTLVTDHLNLNISMDSWVRIYDSRGQIIFTKHMKNGLNELNTSNWSKGVYFVSIQNDEKNISARIVK